MRAVRVESPPADGMLPNTSEDTRRRESPAMQWLLKNFIGKAHWTEFRKGEFLGGQLRKPSPRRQTYYNIDESYCDSREPFGQKRKLIKYLDDLNTGKTIVMTSERFKKG